MVFGKLDINTPIRNIDYTMFLLCSKTTLQVVTPRSHGTASVEQLLDPSLCGKPIAVGGGVVLAASYEAKAFGVGNGMPGWQACELCPHLTFVNGHYKEYKRLGNDVINVIGFHTTRPANFHMRPLPTWRLAGRPPRSEFFDAPWFSLQTELAAGSEPIPNSGGL